MYTCPDEILTVWRRVRRLRKRKRGRSSVVMCVYGFIKIVRTIKVRDKKEEGCK